jgi:hypothetical protein
MSRGPAPWKSSDVAWRGHRRPYDLLKELTVSGLIVVLLVVAASVVFASPDPPPATFREWSQQAPKDFSRTTLEEIKQTSLSATYGPPYQTTEQSGSTQGFGPLSPERWFGEAIPVNTWQDFVARPLRSTGRPQVVRAIDEWDSATAAQQATWGDATRSALDVWDPTAATPPEGGESTVVLELPRDSGPLAVLLPAQLDMAQTGALDAALLADTATRSSGGTVWYSNDQTRALLYFGDSGEGGAGPDCIAPGQAAPADGGCWFYNLSVDNSAPRFGGYLAGDTWGVINEVGNWPGAWWLFPYSFWYQWGPGLTSDSADLYAMIMTGLVSIPFILLPFIPGLRDIPKGTRVYRLMWSSYYREVEEVAESDRLPGRN